MSGAFPRPRRIGIGRGRVQHLVVIHHANNTATPACGPPARPYLPPPDGPVCKWCRERAEELAAEVGR
jgi:hypothetical protein